MAKFYLYICVLLTLVLGKKKKVSNFREKMALQLDFDETTEYPKDWRTFNTAVILDDRIVVAPKTKQEPGGQVFLKKFLNTPAWEAEMTIDVQTTQVDGPLFAIWHLAHKPMLDPKRHSNAHHLNTFGYKDEFAGIGVYVYVSRGQYMVHAIHNQGVDKINEDYVNKFADFIRSDSVSEGCRIKSPSETMSFTISMTEDDFFNVHINSNGYIQHCIQDMLVLNLGGTKYKKNGSLGLTGSTSQGKNLISLRKVQIYNLAQESAKRAHQDQDKEEQKLRRQNAMRQEQEEVLDSVDMTEEAIDLPTAAKELQERAKEYQKNNLARLEESDNTEMLLFKIYETHKHINDRIKVLEKRETEQGKFMQDLTKVQEYIGQYEKDVPQRLESLMDLLNTVDYQLGQITELIAKTGGPGNTPANMDLVLPKITYENLAKVEAQIKNLESAFQNDYMSYQSDLLELIRQADRLGKESSSVKRQTLGENWEPSSFRIINNRFLVNQENLLETVRQAGQWAYVVQVTLLVLATLAVLLVLYKHSVVANKIM